MVASIRSLASSLQCNLCSCDICVTGGGVYDGGELACLRISVGEASVE